MKDIATDLTETVPEPHIAQLFRPNRTEVTVLPFIRHNCKNAAERLQCKGRTWSFNELSESLLAAILVLNLKQIRLK